MVCLWCYLKKSISDKTISAIAINTSVRSIAFCHAGFWFHACLVSKGSKAGAIPK
jgi:hypothetical protein